MDFKTFFDDKKELDIIMLGRIAIDFNPIDYGKPLWESTTFEKFIGGSAINTAIGLSRLGSRVGFLGKVSGDQFGEYGIRVCKEEGVDTSHITRHTDNSYTMGLTFTEILADGSSSIMMHRGHAVDLELTMEDVDEDYIKKAKMLLISGTSLAKSPSREAALKAMTLAKKNNVKIIFDLDYRNYTWQSLDEVSLYYSIVADNSDIISGSRGEFDYLERLIGLDGKDETSANYWLNRKCKIVIIKHGKDGSVAYTQESEKYTILPFPTKLLKSFGGGDGYASSFLHCLFDGRDLKDCFMMATTSAAILVSSRACSSFMPTLPELEKQKELGIKEHGELVSVEKFEFKKA